MSENVSNQQLEPWWTEYVDRWNTVYPAVPLYDTQLAKFFVRRAVKFILTGSIDGDNSTVWPVRSSVSDGGVVVTVDEDSHDVDRWKQDLIVAGWISESAHKWRAPDGSLWRGPYGAWKELQKSKVTERGSDSNFPLSETLRLLVEWAQHLHVSHECDCDGWEQRSFLIEAAQRYQREIAATASPAAPKEQIATDALDDVLAHPRTADPDTFAIARAQVAALKAATTPSPDAAREAPSGFASSERLSHQEDTGMTKNYDDFRAGMLRAAEMARSEFKRAPDAAKGHDCVYMSGYEDACDHLSVAIAQAAVIDSVRIAGPQPDWQYHIALLFPDGIDDQTLLKIYQVVEHELRRTPDYERGYVDGHHEATEHALRLQALEQRTPIVAAPTFKNTKEAMLYAQRQGIPTVIPVTRRKCSKCGEDLGFNEGDPCGRCVN